MMSALLAIAWLISVLSVVTYEELNQTVTAWGIEAITPRRVRASSAMGFALIFALTGVLFRRVEGREQTVSYRSPPEALYEAQLRELTALDKFIGGKDEYQLRELFGFPEILRYNILLVKRSVAPSQVSAGESADLKRFLAGGSGHLDLRWARAHCHNLPTGTIFCKPTPGEVFVVDTPRHFAEMKQRLLQFESSPELPVPVCDKVRDLDKTVDQNILILREVLSDRLAANPDNILYDADKGSPYYAATSNAYWRRFIDLQPKAEAITEAIRDYLGTNR